MKSGRSARPGNRRRSDRRRAPGTFELMFAEQVVVARHSQGYRGGQGLQILASEAQHCEWPGSASGVPLRASRLTRPPRVRWHRPGGDSLSVTRLSSARCTSACACARRSAAKRPPFHRHSAPSAKRSSVARRTAGSRATMRHSCPSVMPVLPLGVPLTRAVRCRRSANQARSARAFDMGAARRRA